MSDQLSGLHGAVTYHSFIHTERSEKADAHHPCQCLQTAIPGVSQAHHQTQGVMCSMHHQDTSAQRFQFHGNATQWCRITQSSTGSLNFHSSLVIVNQGRVWSQSFNLWSVIPI